MSKVDAMRALREQRFSEVGKTPKKRVASTEPTDEQCTYVSKTSGKRCTRDKDHPEKTHRYALKA